MNIEHSIEPETLRELLAYRQSDLIAYSKYVSVRGIEPETLARDDERKIFESMGKSGFKYINIDVNGFAHVFIVEKLAWDSDYFARPMYKLHYVLYAHNRYPLLMVAVKKFVSAFAPSDQGAYCFIDIPSEDIVLIQALTEASFRLVETRNHQFIDLRNREFKRFPTRRANSGDIANLRRVAAMMRNRFDRFHADTYFDDIKADEYLGKFAEESIKGFADIVIVPDVEGLPTDAFFAANLLKKEWGRLGEKVSQFVLAAVSAETCRGWYIKLLSDLCHQLQDAGADYIITNTQTTNKAAIHSNEKLSFKYGHTTHILTICP